MSAAVLAVTLIPSRAVATAAVATARCRLDARLAPAARAALVEESAVDAERLRALTLQAGIAAPSVRMWVGRGTPAAIGRRIDEWLAAQNLRTAWTRCASARVADRWAIALAPRSAEVTPLAARARPGQSVTYSFVLPAFTSEPVLLVEGPDGRVATSRADGPVVVRFTAPGAYSLQVVAETPDGPLAFATWSAHVVGDVTPGRAETAPESPGPSDPIALRSAINARRESLGLSPLRRDPLLESLAQERASELAARGVVVHALGPYDSPVDRLRRGGVEADGVAENVARARSIAEADRNLERSPSHHGVRTNAQLDALGVGVARHGTMVYVVEIYATHPRLGSAE